MTDPSLPIFQRFDHQATSIFKRSAIVFSRSTLPDRFTLASDDDEVNRAEALFRSRSPENLRSSELGIRAQWPEVFLTKAALHYFMPGFVRLILEQDDKDALNIDDFLSILAPDLLATFDGMQKHAVQQALEFIREELSERAKQIIDRRLSRLKA